MLLLAARKSKQIPRSLQNRPELSMYERWVFESYLQLNGSRNYTSVGPAFIPYNVTICWLNENRITCREEREDVLYLFNRMDAAYVQQCNKSKGES